MGTVRAAAVQAAPVHLDLDASLAKALDLVAEAARGGAGLVAFPETWLPGYPAWLDCCRDVALWDHPPVKAVFRRLASKAVDVPGPVTKALADAARAHGVVLNMSVHERDGGTLYNTMLTFDADGTLAQRHRKIMPTYTERLLWGMGDGRSLEAAPTAAGTLGGLICWEHWMPLACQALHQSNEQVHVAAWPQVKEMNLVASRHYAFEGRCYVMACGAILRRADLPPELEVVDETPDPVLNGGSAIIGPDGALLAGPLFDDETILYADLDLGRVAEEHMTLDVAGHYARPDILGMWRKTPGAPGDRVDRGVRVQAKREYTFFETDAEGFRRLGALFTAMGDLDACEHKVSPFAGGAGWFTEDSNRGLLRER